MIIELNDKKLCLNYPMFNDKIDKIFMDEFKRVNNVMETIEKTYNKGDIIEILRKEQRIINRGISSYDYNLFEVDMINIMEV